MLNLHVSPQLRIALLIASYALIGSSCHLNTSKMRDHYSIKEIATPNHYTSIAKGSTLSFTIAADSSNQYQFRSNQ